MIRLNDEFIPSSERNRPSGEIANWVALLKHGDPAEQRRGWGIKLIKTLMDEVEFERVDEGTSLRMTKYLRS